ncbi:olfactory receptor 52N5-like [Thalassophryne amazonica]|uniref:olfactory receptor 52N5-like n=1 Tax=Thalassophryne amazonica TaxID=390379 RepID=UPI0014722350|nr:olfactory receptor 52N5-like [Thalassophryne amazonica]
MENYTYNSLMLQMERLNISEDYVHAIFVVVFFTYMFIMVANAGITLLIFINKNLHQPMFLLYCNLSLNDILGNCVAIPRLLSDMLMSTSERIINYNEYVIQAFVVHLSATAAHTVLMIMAFDRYMAICNPLHYTSKMVLKLSLSAWGVGFVLVGILIGLSVRLNRCRTLITNLVCDNASLFKLSCDSVFISNVYGLTFTAALFTSSISSIVLTYTKIAVVCLTTKNNSLNKKALKTCSTHLTVYLIMFICGMMIVVLHRFPQFSYYRKVCSILLYMIPSSLQPIIYGIQSEEIRKSLLKLFRNLTFWHENEAFCD